MLSFPFLYKNTWRCLVHSLVENLNSITCNTCDQETRNYHKKNHLIDIPKFSGIGSRNGPHWNLFSFFLDIKLNTWPTKHQKELSSSSYFIIIYTNIQPYEDNVHTEQVSYHENDGEEEGKISSCFFNESGLLSASFSQLFCSVVCSLIRARKFYNRESVYICWLIFQPHCLTEAYRRLMKWWVSLMVFSASVSLHLFLLPWDVVAKKNVKETRAST